MLDHGYKLHHSKIEQKIYKMDNPDDNDNDDDGHGNLHSQAHGRKDSMNIKQECLKILST